MTTDADQKLIYSLNIWTGQGSTRQESAIHLMRQAAEAIGRLSDHVTKLQVRLNKAGLDDA